MSVGRMIFSYHVFIFLIAVAALIVACFALTGYQTAFVNPTCFKENVTLNGCRTHSNGMVTLSSEDNITAVSGGQAEAYQLRKQMSVVTVVAASDDGVRLPVACKGMFLVVENQGANTLAIWPNGENTINNSTSGGYFELNPTAMSFFISADGSTWNSV